MNSEDQKNESNPASKSVIQGQVQVAGQAQQTMLAQPALISPPSAEVVRETSPQGRYVKLEDRLGSGAYKDVWRAYDTNEGIEVAWNVVKLNRIPPTERRRIKTEVKLLKDIQHKNVIKYYNSWVDREKEQIVFITEIMSSGSLKDYLRKNPMIRWNAVKRWCRQILRGLEFLHTKHVIHRDIKCDNIFINGATGDLRIGDLGLSTKISEHEKAASVDRPITAATMTCLGTPEFMAPELYEENYNEKVDIYAFGMSLLEMVTGLMPYHDCTSAPQIYKKVLNGELPPELDLVARSNSRAAEFIQACLQHQDKRPSATELLADDFLKPNEAEDYSEVRVKLYPLINAIAEQDEEEDEEDVPQNEMDGPRKSNDDRDGEDLNQGSDRKGDSGIFPLSPIEGSPGSGKDGKVENYTNTMTDAQNERETDKFDNEDSHSFVNSGHSITNANPSPNPNASSVLSVRDSSTSSDSSLFPESTKSDKEKSLTSGGEKVMNLKEKVDVVSESLSLQSITERGSSPSISISPSTSGSVSQGANGGTDLPSIKRANSPLDFEQERLNAERERKSVGGRVRRCVLSSTSTEFDG
jgi:WNK lysine deficient protein kinase